MKIKLKDQTWLEGFKPVIQSLVKKTNISCYTISIGLQRKGLTQIKIVI